MYASALMAFLHHLAAFTVTSALAVEIALFRMPLGVREARRLSVADAVFGVSAGVLLLVGLLRVMYFEKGPDYYWHDLFFLIKFAAFLLAALTSLYPTATFLAFRPALRAGEAPQLTAARVTRVRLCLMIELSAIVLILLCAPLMARGFGLMR